ncbi:hypothetical protein BDZ97DRAFT_1703298 [Flammula alnicola]|nr:hypothetical protein BDZ97DRAFT_1703298 [Flammula alnicola]
MNTTEPLEQPHVDKGKGRALDPTERTPLLGSSSTAIEEAITPADSRRRLRSTLTTVFLISLCICILGFVIIALLAWSYASRASHLKPEDILNDDLVFAGPDRVDVLNITDDGVWLNVRGRIGIDAGRAIDIGSDPDDGVFRDIWKTVGRWSVRTLDRVSVNMTTIRISPEYDTSVTLVYLDIQPIELPLSVDPPKDTSWLTPVSRPVHVRLTSNSTVVLQFLKDSWRRGALAVRAEVGQATIRGGGLNSDSWRSNFRGKLSNIRTSIHIRLPSIPGLPHPGKNVPFPSIASLITLKSFNVSSEPDKLILHATASVLNPASPSFNLSVPSLPFVISVPNKNDTTPISLASVSSAPFALTHPNITLLLAGGVLPISTQSFPVISNFVTRYLSGEPNAILVSSPLLPPAYAVEAEFPAPIPRPQILRNVTIKDMKIKPTGSVFLASGMVQGRVVLPAGMHVGLDILRVLPDVLIFDGEVPPSPGPIMYKKKNRKHADPDLPEEPPLPDPLPEHAFGHIRPETWLPAVSVPATAEDGDGAAYAISAKVVDVPLEVLPGRQKEFSNFVGKVIFGSEAATAGIQGFAAVTVTVEGLPLHGPGRKDGEIVLSGLPFQGSVRIGKRSLLMGHEPNLEQVLDNLGLSIPL